MDKKPWEDSNHAYYGPCRRLFLVCSLLGLDIESMTRHGQTLYGYFIAVLERYGGNVAVEGQAMRETVVHALLLWNEGKR